MRALDDNSGGSAVAGVWLPTLAGLSALLVGIGLARFAYSPLIPPLIEEGWFSPAAAAYLGAANLAGYLAGALAARPLARRHAPAPLLRLMMVLAGISFLACAWPLPFLWFFLWRFLAGFAGGTLMVLAAPTILARVPAARRGLAGGVVLTGVGIGIAASGLLVPPLLSLGLGATWIGLGVLALVLTALSWNGWPRVGPAPMAGQAMLPPEGAPRALRALFLVYGLTAVGLVPHMVFLVDFISRGLGQGVTAGANHWILFGLGALFGATAFGHLGDRLGFRRGLRLMLLADSIAIGMLALIDGPVALVVSSTFVGASIPGIVTVTLGRVHELVHDEERRRAAWSIATVAFSVGQAAAAYGFSFLYAEIGSYALLFALGGAVFLLALIVDLVADRPRPAQGLTRGRGRTSEGAAAARPAGR